jgi:hypothetical protein
MMEIGTANQSLPNRPRDSAATDDAEQGTWIASLAIKSDNGQLPSYLPFGYLT